MTTSERHLLPRLATKLNVGDVVFIRVLPKPFREVASPTGTWTNHVGIIIESPPTASRWWLRANFHSRGLHPYRPLSGDPNMGEWPYLDSRTL